MQVTLRNVRVAYVHVFEPSKAKGSIGDPKYSISSIIEPDSENEKVLKEAIKAVAVDKWKDKASETLARLKASNRLCLHRGEEKPNPEYQGKLFVNSNNDAQPAIKALNGKTNLTKADGKPYSGCYCNVIIDVWPQANDYGERINAKLLGIQFVSDGAAFSAGVTRASDDAFEDLSAGAEGEIEF